jgi:hypothetical protein
MKVEAALSHSSSPCAPHHAETRRCISLPFSISFIANIARKRPELNRDKTNATFALVNDGMDIHALAKQMGTSIGMIERHYSHLTPRMKKDMFTGKRYELSAEEYAVQKAAGDS